MRSRAGCLGGEKVGGGGAGREREGQPRPHCADACGNAATIFRARRVSARGRRAIPDRARAGARARLRRTMTKLTLRDLEVRGQRVLVRVDFNVPTEERDGKIAITDDTRIRESLPTINYLREQGAKTILMAHFGRPKGKPVGKYSLRPIADYLHTLIDHPVAFSHDTIGKIPEAIIRDMKQGDVTLLENVRFHPGEEANDPGFAEALAKRGHLYANDAFGAAHRAHASTAGITKFLKRSAMGFLMEKEIQYLSHELAEPAEPIVVLLGGSRVSGKIGVIKALMEKAETILIGGAMANTF